MPDACSRVIAGYARNRGRIGRADPSADDNAAGVTSLKKLEARGHRYGRRVDQGCERPGVTRGRDIHQSSGKNMRFFQAECLAVYVGDTMEIRGAPAASSPRIDPDSSVNGDACRE